MPIDEEMGGRGLSPHPPHRILPHWGRGAPEASGMGLWGQHRPQPCSALPQGCPVLALDTRLWPQDTQLCPRDSQLYRRMPGSAPGMPISGSRMTDFALGMLSSAPGCLVLSQAGSHPFLPCELNLGIFQTHRAGNNPLLKRAGPLLQHARDKRQSVVRAGREKMVDVSLATGVRSITPQPSGHCLP